MASIYPIQAIFSKGELTPRLHSRTDIDIYKKGLQSCTNLVPMVHGGVYRRSGTRYVRPSIGDGNDRNVRLIPFVFSSVQSYVMELGENDGQQGKIRLYTNAGYVIDPASPPNPYEIDIPYSHDEIWDVDFVQSADTIYFVHPDYDIYFIKRKSETDWETGNLVLKNGPFLPLYGGENVLTIGGTGQPSATYSASTISSESGPASDAFDGDPNTFWATTAGNQAGWLNMDFAGTDEFGCNGVKLTFTSNSNWPNEQMAPNSFSIQGWSGSQWVTLFTVTGETGWTFGETREYTWPDNGQKYTIIRYQVNSNNGSTWSAMGDIVYSLVDVPTTISWETTDGINGGTGLVDPDDVGRLVRYLGGDGIWRIATIENITSPTSFTGTATGFWNSSPNTPATAWQLGAISKQAGYPSSITIYQQRLVFGGTRSAPTSVFFSKIGIYNDFGISEPVQDDDAITLDLSGEQQDSIVWVREMGDKVYCGTRDNVMSIGGTQSLTLSPTSFLIRTETARGSQPVRPQRVGRSILYVGEHLNELHSLAYSEQAGAFDSSAITIYNQHLFKAGVKQMAWSEGPEYILTALMNDGSLVSMVYERDQEVVGGVQVVVGGDDVEVESVAAISENGRDAVYALVKRTIDNVTRRYIERFEEMFEFQESSAAWFVDSGLPFTFGTPTNTITGLDHLEGQTVEVYATNNDPGGTDLIQTQGYVVSSGEITTQSEVTDGVVGLGYLTSMKTLRISERAGDGSGLGRRSRPDGIMVDCNRSRSVFVRGETEGSLLEEVIPRSASDSMDLYTPLFTGMKPFNYVDSSWESFGVVELQVVGPHPAMVLSLTPIIEREP